MKSFRKVGEASASVVGVVMAVPEGGWLQVLTDDNIADAPSISPVPGGRKDSKWAGHVR